MPRVTVSPGAEEPAALEGTSVTGPVYIPLIMMIVVTESRAGPSLFNSPVFDRYIYH